MISASTTGISRSLKSFETDDFPVAIPPVRPMTASKGYYTLLPLLEETKDKPSMVVAVGHTESTSPRRLNVDARAEMPATLSLPHEAIECLIASVPRLSCKDTVTCLAPSPSPMATDNQFALTRAYRGSAPNLNKTARQVVPQFLQKLYELRRHSIRPSSVFLVLWPQWAHEILVQDSQRSDEQRSYTVVR